MSEEERQEWCPPRRPRDLRECSVRVALVSLSSRCRVQLGGEVNLLVRKRSVVLVRMLMCPKSHEEGGSGTLKQSIADLLELKWRFQVGPSLG